YQAVLLVNFTALSAAFPFWIFAAAAVTRWQGERAHTSLSAPSLTLPTRWGGKITRIAGLAAVAGLIALAVPAVINTYLADQLLKTSVDAYVTGQPRPLAEQPAQQAHQLAPWEPVYDTELGNIAYQYEDLEAARTAYGDAVALGTFDPRVYRNLAVAVTPLGCQVGQKIGVGSPGPKCAARTASVVSPGSSPLTSATPTVSYAPPPVTASAPQPAPLPVPSPTRNPAYPPYQYDASGAYPPIYEVSSQPQPATVSLKCRLPIYANGSGSGGFLEFPG